MERSRLINFPGGNDLLGGQHLCIEVVPLLGVLFHDLLGIGWVTCSLLSMELVELDLNIILDGFHAELALSQLSGVNVASVSLSGYGSL